MKKKKIIIVSILTVIACLILIIICLCLKNQNNEITTMSNKELIKYADKMLNSENFEQKSSLYEELFVNRKIEDSEYLEIHSDVNDIKATLLSDYMAALLVLEHYDSFGKMYNSIYTTTTNDEFSCVLKGLFSLMNFYSEFDDSKYENTYNYLSDFILKNSLDDNQKNLDSLMFLYFYSTSINRSSDTSEIKEKIQNYVNETQNNYDDYFSKNRLLYIDLLLRLEKYDRFRNSFAYAYSEDEKFNSLEIMYISNSDNLQVEQLIVLRDALNTLLQKSTGGVSDRYLQIESEKKSVENIIDIYK